MWLRNVLALPLRSRHRKRLNRPRSFDILKDDLGGPRSTFPHTVYLACGTQAATARQNYVAFLRLASLGQGRHGKKAAPVDSDDEESDDEDSDEDGDSDMGEEGAPEMKGAPGEAPATFHFRMVAMNCGVNRIRSMPQQPGVVAVWGDNAQVRALTEWTWGGEWRKGSTHCSKESGVGTRGLPANMWFKGGSCSMGGSQVQ